MTEKNLNWRGPFLLAVLLFVLGSFAYWKEFSHRPKQEEKEQEAKRLFVLKDRPVRTVVLSTGKKTYSFNCLDFDSKLCKPGENSKWEVTQPVKLRADDSNVNSFLSTLNNISAAETIDLKDETPEKRAALLKEYGLDQASRSNDRKVELTTASGNSVLYLGAMHPIGESFFALKGESVDKVDENTVYLVANYFKSNFEKDLTFWRDKKLLTLAAHDVVSFQLEGGKAKMVSGERKDGQWTLTIGKERFPGDMENIEAMLNSASYLAAKDFVSEDKNDKVAKTAIKGIKPVLKLVLEKQAPAPGASPSPAAGAPAANAEKSMVVLTFYRRTKPADKLYATVSNLDPLFELDMNALERFDKDVKSLRLAKLITSMERFTAKRLEFSGRPMGDQSLVLSNSDGKWLEMPSKAEKDADKVQRFLDRLSGNRIQDFLSGKNVPAGEQDGLKIAIGDEKSDVKRQYLFWKKDGKLYARDLISKRPEVFVVDSSIQDDLPWKRDFFDKAAAPSARPAESKK